MVALGLSLWARLCGRHLAWVGLSFLSLVFDSNATLSVDSFPSTVAYLFFTIHAYRYNQNVFYLLVRIIRGIIFHFQAQSTRLNF